MSGQESRERTAYRESRGHVGKLRGRTQCNGEYIGEFTIEQEQNERQSVQGEWTSSGGS